MSCVIFRTDGELDFKSITTFGMNSKPNTKSPIGYFGTGLKYAIAVLVREKIPVSLWIGNRCYEFYVKEISFRDKEFGQIMYRQKNTLFSAWTNHELPFTTELGKNWKLWQAFREIESNTRDENGKTEVWNDQPAGATFEQIIPKGPGKTLFIISGDAFTKVFADRDNIFLPNGLTLYEGDETVQIFKQPSNHLYYRGLRVLDLEKPALFTYNILAPVTLTEDRTIKDTWDVGRTICQRIVRSDDAELIAKVVDAKSDKFFEGTLDFEYTYTSPSQTFLDVLRKKKARNHPVLPRARAYYSTYVPETPPTTPDEEKLWYKLQEIIDSRELCVRGPEDITVLNKCQAYLKEHDR